MTDRIQINNADDWICARLLAQLVMSGTQGASADYDRPFERVLKSLRAVGQKLRQERREAVRRVDELLSRPPDLQQERIRRSFRHLKCRPVANELLKRALCLTRREPREAERLTELAYSVLREILSETAVREAGGSRILASARARTLGHLGNLARINERWEQSYQWFAMAFREWEIGSGDAGLEAELLYLYGSLLRDRQHYGAALRVLDSAQRIYEEIGEDHRRGLTLIKRATVLSGIQEGDLALQVHLEGALLLDESREPEATLIAWVNLAEYYRRLGRTQEAAEALANVVEATHVLTPDSSAVLCFVWVSGRVALAQGEAEEAETRFLRLVKAFGEREQEYDRGLAGLDLMKVYVLKSRIDDLLRIAGPTFEALRSQGLAPEAIEVLDLLAQAVEQRRVEVRLIDRVAEALGRCGRHLTAQ